jgi:hypothetical protein
MKEHCSAKACQLWDGSGPTVAGGAAARSVPKTDRLKSRHSSHCRRSADPGCLFQFTCARSIAGAQNSSCFTTVIAPDEVAAGAKEPSPPRGQVTYFDGKMKWYAFG